MRQILPTRLLRRALALMLTALLLVTPVSAATIIINNVDGPGEGFNDPTPANPEGGNTGTTLGEQRLIAFQHAANLWGARIPSNVTIVIQAAFNPLTCTATSAVLGAAGAIQIFANFPGTELLNTWYAVALANRLGGVDLAPAPAPFSDDIVATFNSNLNGNPACLGGRRFYFGLDNNHGTNIDLVTVLLHEFGHGLGFANFVTEASGSRPLGLGDVFSEYTRDVSTGKTWNQMSTTELVASAINDRKVVWDGLHVATATPGVLDPGMPALKITAPATLAGSYSVGVAQFGAPLTPQGVSGQIVAGLDAGDAAGPSTFDGCSPLTNGSDVAGNIALIDRGTCGFAVKAANAQAAGASGVIIANIAPGSAPAMGGVDPSIVIPAVSVVLADGNAIRAALAGGSTVTGAMLLDLTVLRGTEFTSALPMLFAPNPVQPGSSISHWDVTAFPNQLMEPAINADLTHSIEPPEDMTLSLMQDIGWFPDRDSVPSGRDECPASDSRPTVVIGACDSGVPNAESVLGTLGCRISDFVEQCFENAQNHGAAVSCVSHLTNVLKDDGVLKGNQKGKIQSCAAKSK
jgi:hypothetical protein